MYKYDNYGVQLGLYTVKKYVQFWFYDFLLTIFMCNPSSSHTEIWLGVGLTCLQSGLTSLLENNVIFFSELWFIMISVSVEMYSRLFKVRLADLNAALTLARNGNYSVFVLPMYREDSTCINLELRDKTSIQNGVAHLRKLFGTEAEMVITILPPPTEVQRNEKFFSLQVVPGSYSVAKQKYVLAGPAQEIPWSLISLCNWKYNLTYTYLDRNMRSPFVWHLSYASEQMLAHPPENDFNALTEKMSSLQKPPDVPVHALVEASNENGKFAVIVFTFLF